MDKKKTEATQDTTTSKKTDSKRNESSTNTEDAKAIAEKIFANLKKPK